VQPPHYVGPNASIDDALISNGCKVFGKVKHSILSDGVYVGESATVVDSVLLPGATVEDGAQVIHAILGEGATVKAGVTFGSADPNEEIALVGDDVVVGKE
jgi:glucose-1-phosphate adenylyltransferase